MRVRVRGLRMRLWAAGVVILLSACGADSPQELLGKAKAKTEAGDLQSAAVLLKQAIQSQPGQWDLRSALGDLLLRGGAAAEAQIEFEKALELNGPKAELVPKLADAMIGSGAAKALIERYGATDLGDGKSNALLKSWLAEAQLEVGDLAKAAAAVEDALKLDANANRAKLIKARMLVGKRDLDGGLALVNEAIASDPSLASAKHLKAELLWVGKSDPASAETLLKEVLEQQPEYLPAYSTLMSILAQQTRFDEYATVLDKLKARFSRTPLRYFFETRLHLARRSLDKASASAQELLRVAPDHALSLQLAGAVDFERGMQRSAEAHLAKAIQIQPDLVVARQMLARIYLSRGQPRAALDVLKPNLAAAAPDARSLAVAGEASMQLGELDQAADWFERASKLAPADALSKTALAVLAARDGKPDTSVGQLQALAENDKSVFADLALLSIRLRRGQSGEAFAITDRLAAKLPGSPLPALLRGRIHLSLGDAGKARRAFEDALRVRADDFQAKAALVNLDLMERAFAPAAERVDSLLKADPGNYSAHLLAAAVLQRSGGSDEKIMGHLREAIRLSTADASPRVMTIEYLASLHKNEAAKTMAQEAAAAFPDDLPVMRALGNVLIRSGDLQQAIVVLTRAVKLRPDDAAVQLTLADAHLAKRDERSALSVLLAAVEVVPESSALRARLIALSLRQSRMADAQRAAKELQRRLPDQAAGWVLESELAEARRDFQAALAPALVALRKQDGISMAPRVLGLQFAAGKPQDAERFTQEWLRDHPKDTLFLRFLGERAMQKPDYAAAEDAFRRIVAVNPSDAIALNNLAWSMLKAGKADAVAYADKAVALMPGNPALLDTQADALTLAGRPADAVAVLRRAAALAPNNPVGRLKLAKALSAQDAKADAKAELEALLAAHPKFEGRASAEAMLRGLR
ncbi:hypothetical protein AQPW35_35090 [Rubrivivax pictus]|uniref:Lipoprotein n=2 Tax=Pseudaquabacterium pictum TaxID=2315236 RepID=A0A480B020_9BURK|nr:hypothetical protein AQPW35_35090 [Rubrivivax pictus]